MLNLDTRDSDLVLILSWITKQKGQQSHKIIHRTIQLLADQKPSSSEFICQSGIQPSRRQLSAIRFGGGDKILGSRSLS
jgi:hypothetical protein